MSINDFISNWRDPRRSYDSAYKGGKTRTFNTVFGSITAAEAMSNPTVATCLHLMSSNLAESEWYSTNPDLDRVLRNPNPDQTQYQWFQTIVNEMVGTGESYHRIVGRNPDRPDYFIPVARESVEPVYDGLRSPNYVVTDSRGNKETVTSERMLRFRDVSTVDVTATSRLEYLAPLILMLNEANALIKSNFKHGLRISLGAFVSPDLGEEDRDNLLEDMINTFGNRPMEEGNRRGGVGVFDNTMEIKEFNGGQDASSVDLRELRKHLILEISAGMMTPPFLAGGDSDTKYSNATSRTNTMYRVNFSPIITNLLQTLNKRYRITNEEGRYVRTVFVDAVPLMFGDQSILNKTAIELVRDGLITPNEARRIYLRMARIDDPAADELRTASSGPSPDTPDGEIDRPADDGTQSELTNRE